MNTAISIKPENPLFDKPFEVVISGVKANTTIRVDCLLKNDEQPWYLSFATYMANKDGVVNIAKDAPMIGTYSGVDAMGLLWSMQPYDKTINHLSVNGNENEVCFMVSINDDVILQKSIIRSFSSPDIEKKIIQEKGLIGAFCYPKGKTNLPGIMTVSGSGGGFATVMAEILASNGYAVLALGYFGKGGLPQNLENIDLEYFYKAIQWLKRQPEVNKNNIILRGPSRGGELVLLLAATFPNEINGVIAIAPSSVLIGGFPYPNRPAWGYKNVPFTPYLGGLFNDDPNLTEADDLRNSVKMKLIAYHEGTFEDPYVINDLFLGRIQKYQNTLEEMTIPVEKIRCPMLLISGEKDLVHPATYHCNRIMERLDKMQSPIERKHLYFRDAGHNFRTPYEPKIDLPSSFGDFIAWSGGTLEGNAKAGIAAWEEMLNFINKLSA